MIDLFNPDRIFQSISFKSKSGVQLLSSSKKQKDPIVIPKNLCFDQDPNLVKKLPLRIDEQSPVSLVQITIYGRGDLSSFFLESQNLSADKSFS